MRTELARPLLCPWVRGGKDVCNGNKKGGNMPKERLQKKIKRRRVTLTLKAPKAKEVILMGDFNKWNAKTHPMKRIKGGVWEKIVMLPPGRHEYKFLVDGNWWTDPNNDQTCYNCFGTQNSVMVTS
jgi:hypothetical protein